MGKLFFLRKWNDNGAEGTWSGTPYGILSALKEDLGGGEPSTLLI